MKETCAAFTEHTADKLQSTGCSEIISSIRDERPTSVKYWENSREGKPPISSKGRGCSSYRLGVKMKALLETRAPTPYAAGFGIMQGSKKAWTTPFLVHLRVTHKSSWRASPTFSCGSAPSPHPLENPLSERLELSRKVLPRFCKKSRWAMGMKLEGTVVVRSNVDKDIQCVLMNLIQCPPDS